MVTRDIERIERKVYRSRPSVLTNPIIHDRQSVPHAAVRTEFPHVALSLGVHQRGYKSGQVELDRKYKRMQCGRPHPRWILCHRVQEDPERWIGWNGVVWDGVWDGVWGGVWVGA